MLPEATGQGQHFQDLGNSFSLYGPPSRQITYDYNDFILSRIYREAKKLTASRRTTLTIKHCDKTNVKTISVKKL